MKYVFAWTAAGHTYPEYVNFSLNREGNLVVSVRDKATALACGNVACMTLPREHVEALQAALREALEEK